MAAPQKKKGLIHVLEAITIFITAVICVNTSANVFFRYVLNHALDWSEEVAGYLLVWLTLIGAVLGLHGKQHVGFDWMVNKFSGKARLISEMAGKCLIGTFLVVLTYYGMVLTVKGWDDRAVTFPISKGIILIILPISGILMLTVLVRQFITDVRNLMSNQMK
jgi:TRAP-type transport system small permease protein